MNLNRYTINGTDYYTAHGAAAELATFEPGELGRLLRYPGEQEPVPRRTVLRTLARAQRLGLIQGHRSTLRAWIDTALARSHDKGWTLP